MGNRERAEASQRAYERFAFRVPCDLRVAGADHNGFLLDLSARGLFIETRASAEAGTEVQIRLRPPDSAPIELVGRVARARKAHRAVNVVRTPGLGIELASASEAYFALLMRLYEDEDEA